MKTPATDLWNRINDDLALESADGRPDLGKALNRFLPEIDRRLNDFRASATIAYRYLDNLRLNGDPDAVRAAAELRDALLRDVGIWIGNS